MLEVAKIKPDSADIARDRYRRRDSVMQEYHLFDEIFLEWGVLFAYHWRVHWLSFISLGYDEIPYSMDRSSFISTIEISPLYIKISWTNKAVSTYVENNKRNMDIIKEWQNLNS